MLKEPSIHDSVVCTVCFVDLVGFTAWTSHQKHGAKVVEFLDALFCAFDSATSEMGVCKIKTIGDGYLFAAGVPKFCAIQAVETALRFLILVKVNEAHGTSFDLRIGLASGAAGVVGNLRFAYDLWGETVNIASRVESNAHPGTACIAPSTYQLVKDRFEVTPMEGLTTLKGMMQLYVIGGRK